MELRIFVAVVSIAVIAFPFVMAARMHFGSDPYGINKDYAPLYLVTGIVALFWVGITAFPLVFGGQS